MGKLDEQNEGNFSLGFVVGILLGVTGFFLTKTKEGQEVRKKLMSQWQVVRKKLEAEGKILENDTRITHLIPTIKAKILEFLNEKPARQKRVSRKRKKFKGI